MKAVSVTTTITQVATASDITRAIELGNNSSATVFLQYDGSDEYNTPVVLTAVNGMPLLAGATILVDQRWAKHTVNAIVASGTADLRVQGDSL